ncbi:MAG: hypothetical protein V3T49_05580, partial [Dehalococcoidia bacterium]
GTFAKKLTNEVVLNFASATYFGVIGIYVMGDLLRYFGANPAASRPQKFGWTMFDYSFEQYETDIYDWVDIVKMVISSNFNYTGYEKKFQVIEHDEL